MSNAEFLETALKAAVSAGNLIEERHKDILNVSRKESLRDIVTHVDKLAENQIIDILKDYDKNIPILTEESGFVQGNLEKTYWIVDALDGTVNYVNHIPFYAVSIALFVKNKITVGVIFNPYSNELYYGADGLGVFKNQKSLKIIDKIHEECLFSMAFSGKKYEAAKRVDEFMLFGKINDSSRGCLRTGSAAMNLAYLAEGRFGGCLGKANRIWDIAAGLLLAELAGATVKFKEVDKEKYLVNYIATTPKAWNSIFSNVEGVYQV